MLFCRRQTDQGRSALKLCLRQMEGGGDAMQDQVATSTLSGRSFVDTLPMEVLVRLCSFLTIRERQRLRRVCKTLYQALDDPLLWKEIAIDSFTISDYPGLNAMLARRSAVERLYVRGSFNLVGIAKELCTCAHLQSLKLEQSPCYVADMASVVRALPSLAHLEFQPVNTSCGLGHCTHVMCRALEWQDFMGAVENLGTLTLLSQWDENFIEFLLRQWACVQYRPPNICMSTMHMQAAPPQESIQSRYSSLQDLWKECMENFPPCEEVCQFRITWQASQLLLSDVPIFELNLDGTPLSLSTALCYTQPEANDTVGMHGMLSLSGKNQSEENDDHFTSGRYISSPEFVLSETETKFVKFTAVTPHLTTLSLTEATSLSSCHLEIIAHHCKSLKQLNLSGCKKCLNPLFGLATLASNCVHLQALNIQNIPCNYVERTSEMWMCLAQMESLRHLAIDPCLFQASQEADEFTGEQYSVSDENEIEESLKAMKSIQVLEIQTTLTATKSIPCPHCRNMDSHLVELVGHMTALHTLHIRGVSPVVCGVILKSALHNCKHLRNLSIHMEFSFGLSPADLKHSSIQKLSIRCPRFNITDSMMMALAQASWSTLTHIYFTVRFISKGSVTMLLQDFPHLVACHLYCRDGPIMKPPGEILQFRQKMQELSSARSRVNPLDFAFNEGRSYSGHAEYVTTQSLTQTKLVSWWN